jgi:hypothetical protein
VDANAETLSSNGDEVARAQGRTCFRLGVASHTSPTQILFFENNNNIYK